MRNSYRSNPCDSLLAVPNEFSFYLLIYNEFDPGCQVQPRHPDWNLQTLPLSWNRFSLRLLKYPKWSLVNKCGKLTNIGEKWETKLWFVIITCKFARISLNDISYGYLWCLTIEIIITILLEYHKIFWTTVIREWTVYDRFVSRPQAKEWSIDSWTTSHDYCDIPFQK